LGGRPVIALPLALCLQGRRVLVVGGGTVATRRVREVLHTNALVRVVAPTLTGELQGLFRAGRIEVRTGRFRQRDLARCALVLVATDDRASNRAIGAQARGCGALVNVADDPEACSVYMPAVVRRGSVQIAVSTSGAAPALARSMRAWLEHEVPAHIGVVAELMDEYRSHVRARWSDARERRRFWDDVVAGPVAQLIGEGEGDRARRWMDARLGQSATSGPSAGEVALVVLTSARTDDVTLGALHKLQRADAVVCEGNVADGVLALARRDAEVAKVRERRLARAWAEARALGGQSVVWLRAPTTRGARRTEMDGRGRAARR